MIQLSRIGPPTMPVAPACPVVPTATERKRSKRMAYGHKTEYRPRVRAQIVLRAARGRSNARIAHETGLHLDTVRTWRGRFAHGGLPAPADRKRSGRPAVPRTGPARCASITSTAAEVRRPTWPPTTYTT
ncbi:helix-turn-helix domain-containing protein [Streptomyces sp. NPDC000658]|uniref:helix-turn-helix domain-containing protein n=1 Tax=Streptomyces sp. NPDC000658 TaxID=3154266 RepID=UPI003319E966